MRPIGARDERRVVVERSVRSRCLTQLVTQLFAKIMCHVFLSAISKQGEEPSRDSSDLQKKPLKHEAFK